MANNTGPRCPNHTVLLVDVNWKDQTGICPESGCLFGFDADHAEKNKKLRLNSLGAMEEVKDYKVIQKEGTNG